MRGLCFTGGFFFVLWLWFPPLVSAHEVVGEVTPLMRHANHILSFIEEGRKKEAFQMTEKIYEDFREPGREGWESGLKSSSLRVDKIFGTSCHERLTHALEERNLTGLREGIEFLSFLLMMEKFNVLQRTFDQRAGQSNSRTTIFWLGRNYFSYLLEPVMGKENPVEEKHLDRLLDKMLYSIEDGEWNRFVDLRQELAERLRAYFDFPVRLSH